MYIRNIVIINESTVIFIKRVIATNYHRILLLNIATIYLKSTSDSIVKWC